MIQNARLQAHTESVDVRLRGDRFSEISSGLAPEPGEQRVLAADLGLLKALGKTVRKELGKEQVRATWVAGAPVYGSGEFADLVDQTPLQRLGRTDTFT